MIGNINNTKKILNKYNLRAKKSLGQNFLIDENILQKIVDVSSIDKNTGVIEVGPGIGSLTEHLCKSAKKVLCYEIDKDMIEVLKDTLGFYSNIIIKNIDIMKADVLSDFEYFKDCDQIKVVANLPYYITTAIITKFLSLDLNIADYYFMVQKEVGLRLTSKPATKDYNALSVLMAYKSKSKIEFQVGKNCFFPAPEVDSLIINVHPQKIDLGVKNEANFLKFIQNIFIQRRKTMINNISNLYSIDKQNLMIIFKELDIKETERAENLDILKISCLYKKIFE